MNKRGYLARREFLRFLAACGFSVTAGGTLVSLTGCSTDEAAEQIAQPTSTTGPTADAAAIDEVATPTREPALTDEPSVDVDALRCAAEMGLGALDYSSLSIEEIAV